MSTGQDSDTSESESCCCSVIVMSWLRKVKELVQDPDKSESAQSHADRPEAGKDKGKGEVATNKRAVCTAAVFYYICMNVRLVACQKFQTRYAS